MAGLLRNLKDKDIISLLSRLKTAEAKYPADLLSKRRAAFMTGVAAMGSLRRLGTNEVSGGGHARASLTGMTRMKKLIFALELIVLIGLAAFLATTVYANRIYLKHLLFPNTPTAVQVIPSYLTNTGPTISLTPRVTIAPKAVLPPEATRVPTHRSQPKNTVPPIPTISLTPTITETSTAVLPPEATPVPTHGSSTVQPPTPKPTDPDQD